MAVVDSLHAAGPVAERLVLGGTALESRFGNLAFDVEHRLLTGVAPVRELTSRLAVRIVGRRLVSVVCGERPDVVVSTYPGATEMLARLRLRGRIDVPLVAAITDLASLRFWAHRGVDLHLVIHRESAAEVRAIAGAGAEVLTVRGLNDPGFAVPLDRGEARRALGLAPDPNLVVVSGGGWGVGDLEGAVATVLARSGTEAIVLCGTNERLHERLSGRFAAEPERVHVWGFTSRMPELLAAADALVHSTAGLTVQEAIVRGCAPISYGWGRGHIRANNEAYVRFGLADVAHDRAALATALDRALARPREPDRSFAQLPTAAAVVLERFCGGAGVEDVGQHG